MSMYRIGSSRYAPILLVMVLLVFSLGIVPPTTAWASDGEEGTTGFIAGLDTLVNPDSEREIENDPVRDYEYEPELREVEVREVGEGAEDLTTMGGIQQVVDRANQVSWHNDSNRTNLLTSLRYFLGATGGSGTISENQKLILILPAIGIVFMWWGVRACIRMLMGSFRTGKMSLGGRESVAPQGWSTRDLYKWQDF